jgi:hypothetical protein
MLDNPIYKNEEHTEEERIWEVFIFTYAILQ